MSRRRAGFKVTNPNTGQQMTAMAQVEDSPLPPADLERLHSFRPDLVDKAVKMCEDEAKYRRDRQSKVDWLVFIERFSGLLLCVGLSAFAFTVSYHLAMADHEWTACIISGGTLGSIIATIRKRNNQ